MFRSPGLAIGFVILLLVGTAVLVLRSVVLWLWSIVSAIWTGCFTGRRGDIWRQDNPQAFLWALLARALAAAAGMALVIAAAAGAVRLVRILGLWYGR